MVNNTAYEHGARKLKEHMGPDPNDDFSQEAAENKKPPNGMGLTGRRPLSRSALIGNMREQGDEADCLFDRRDMFKNASAASPEGHGQLLSGLTQTLIDRLSHISN